MGRRSTIKILGLKLGLGPPKKGADEAKLLENDQHNKDGKSSSSSKTFIPAFPGSSNGPGKHPAIIRIGRPREVSQRCPDEMIRSTVRKHGSFRAISQPSSISTFLRKSIFEEDGYEYRDDVDVKENEPSNRSQDERSSAPVDSFGQIPSRRVTRRWLAAVSTKGKEKSNASDQHKRKESDEPPLQATQPSEAIFKDGCEKRDHSNVGENENSKPNSEERSCLPQGISERLQRRRKRWLAKASKRQKEKTKATIEEKPSVHAKSNESSELPVEKIQLPESISVAPTEIFLPVQEEVSDQISKKTLITVVYNQSKEQSKENKPNEEGNRVVSKLSKEEPRQKAKPKEVDTMDDLMRLIREEDTSAVSMRPKDGSRIERKERKRRRRRNGRPVDEPAYDGCVADYDDFVNSLFDVTSLVGIDSPVVYTEEPTENETGCRAFHIFLTSSETSDSDKGSRSSTSEDDEDEDKSSEKEDEMDFDWNEFFSAF